MKKIAFGIVKNLSKQDNKILLVPCSKDKYFLGYWSLPGGEIEKNERVSDILNRKITEQTHLSCSIGKMITSVNLGQHEIYAYDVSCAGLHPRSEHKGKWVSLIDALQYNLSPESKKIIMRITKTKDTKDQKPAIQSFVSCKIKMPIFNEKTQKWEIMVGAKREIFDTNETAIDFYISEARKILQPFFDQSQTAHEHE